MPGDERLPEYHNRVIYNSCLSLVPGTGNSFASFMLGAVENASMALQQPNRSHVQSIGLYAQDNWKISRNITVNYGLRWDYETPVELRQLLVTYQTAGVDPLVSKVTTADPAGPTAITIGRLRADRTYTYTVRGIDDHGGPSGTAQGSFTTGPLPARRQPLQIEVHQRFLRSQFGSPQQPNRPVPLTHWPLRP